MEIKDETLAHPLRDGRNLGTSTTGKRIGPRWIATRSNSVADLRRHVIPSLGSCSERSEAASSLRFASLGSDSTDFVPLAICRPKSPCFRIIGYAKGSITSLSCLPGVSPAHHCSENVLSYSHNWGENLPSSVQSRRNPCFAQLNRGGAVVDSKPRSGQISVHPTTQRTHRRRKT